MPIQYSTRRKNQWLAGILLSVGAINFVLFGVSIGYYGVEAIGKRSGLIITGVISTILGLLYVYRYRTQPDRIVTLTLGVSSENPHTVLPT